MISFGSTAMAVHLELCVGLSSLISARDSMFSFVPPAMAVHLELCSGLLGILDSMFSFVRPRPPMAMNFTRW